MKKIYLHPFHIVDPSPWPFFTGLSSLLLTSGLVFYMHEFQYGFVIFSIGLFSLIASLVCWWRDVVREGTFEGSHTRKVQQGLRIGMLLFIISELMFFVAFFWGFFHFSLAPSSSLGCIWPPKAIEVIAPFGVPLLNTLILLSSGLTVTLAHSSLRAGDLGTALDSLIMTIGLGVLFTFLQLGEYINASFTISDGVYGSIFYMMTGFHGFHVLIGTIFLIVCFFRMIVLHFSREHHLGFEFAIWYWHFVDVIWILLYLCVYIWGNSII